MEHENYASKGVAGAGLGLGIAGTALGVMAGGLGNVGGIFGRNGVQECYVSRFEAEQASRIAELETEVKLRDSNIYTDSKILELYKYVDGKFGIVENQLCEQKVYNATLNGAVSCIQGQIAALQALTKNVIPITNICPQPATATTTGA